MELHVDEATADAFTAIRLASKNANGDPAVGEVTRRKLELAGGSFRSGGQTSKD
jgi:hypothetical protein